MQKPLYLDRVGCRRHFAACLDSRLAVPLTRFLHRLGLGPTHVTLLSFLFSLSGLAVAVVGVGVGRLVGAGLLFVGLVLDHSDGQLARLSGKSTPWGAFLDTALDFFVLIGMVAALTVRAAGQDEGLLRLAGPGWAYGVTALAAALYWEMLGLLHVNVLQRSSGAARPTVPPVGRMPVVLHHDLVVWVCIAGLASPWPRWTLLVLAVGHAPWIVDRYFAFRRAAARTSS